jgi:hypothetical protein
MSLKLDSKQEKEPGPFAAQTKDLERVKKRRPDQAGDEVEAPAVLGEKSSPTPTKEATAAAADLGAMYSEPAAKQAPPAPKLPLPYLPTKPNKNSKRNAGDADDDAQRPADHKPDKADAAPDNKEQGFS